MDEMNLSAASGRGILVGYLFSISLRAAGNLSPKNLNINWINNNTSNEKL